MELAGRLQGFEHAVLDDVRGQFRIGDARAHEGDEHVAFTTQMLRQFHRRTHGTHRDALWQRPQRKKQGGRNSTIHIFRADWSCHINPK